MQLVETIRQLFTFVAVSSYVFVAVLQLEAEFLVVGGCPLVQVNFLSLVKTIEYKFEATRHLIVDIFTKRKEVFGSAWVKV